MKALTTKLFIATRSQLTTKAMHSTSMIADSALYVGDDDDTPLTLNSRPCLQQHGQHRGQQWRNGYLN